ncbi:MAG: N-acetylmuramoyl-L-alanine amidase [Alistipes sp.]|nr:N-acetylmuramoyl-L-alanine amidase [Alistipes sp.]
MLQSYARTFLAPENTREIKKATSSIYLLHRIQLPAVLVECGFLSNPEECSTLQDKNYQLQLASVITAALVEGLEAMDSENAT